MVRSAVRVVARLRPTDQFANDTLQLQQDQKSIVVHTSRRGGNDIVNNAQENHMYKLDLILKDTSQETVFETCALDIVKSVVSGFNGCVMCYGQTGAGKTYTMVGGSDYRTRGISPRAIKAVFDEISVQADKQFEVQVSYLEVYNDRITDLLDPTSTEDFAILEDAKGAITVRGIQTRVCTQEAEALSHLFTGNANRATAEHSLNAGSSRSHAIFTIQVTSRSRVESESASLVGKLHCIDLAGSERLSKTGSEGKILKEAQFINKSLTFLEQVVMALGSSNRSHVPFRQSKLTNILKDSLGGNSKTTMIANMWPEERHTEESISTLKFASRMMRVQTDAAVNVLLDPATHVKQLQRQIAELKAELQMQNQLMGKSHIVYEGEIGEDERYEMEKTVRQYLAGKNNEIPVRSLREVKEYFRIFKAAVDSKDAEVRSSQPAAATSSHDAVASSQAGAKKRQSIAEGAGIGAIDPSSGLSVGVAAPAKGIRDMMKPPANSSPTKSQAAAMGAESNASPMRADPQDDESMADFGRHNNGGPPQSGQPDKNVAFREYKSTEGLKLSQSLKQATEQLAEKRRRAAELSHRVNDCKAVIDVTTQQLEQRRLDRQARGEDEVVDDEEFEIVKLAKEKKAEYRALYDELATTKTARDHLVRLVDHAKQQLLAGFDHWYQRTFAGFGGSTSMPVSARGMGGGATMRGGNDDDDALDEGEKFELLELHRVMDEDPESVAYYKAKKMTHSKHSMKKAPPLPNINRRR